jgi:hypothetical protein
MTRKAIPNTTSENVSANRNRMDRKKAERRLTATR